MIPYPTNATSTLAQVMACYLMAPSHFLSQCCPGSITPYLVIRSQWVNTMKILHGFFVEVLIISYKCTVFCHKSYICYASFCCGRIIAFIGSLCVRYWIFFRVASLALGQSCDCPSASKVTLKDMDKIHQYQNTINAWYFTFVNSIICNLTNSPNIARGT